MLSLEGCQHLFVCSTAGGCVNGTRAIPREPSKSCVVDLAAGAGWCAARARSWFSSQISTKFTPRSCCTRLAAQLLIAWWSTRRLLVVLSGASRTTWPRRVSNCLPVRGGHLYLSIPACGVACSTCLPAPKACPQGRRLGHFLERCPWARPRSSSESTGGRDGSTTRTQSNGRIRPTRL